MYIDYKMGPSLPYYPSHGYYFELNNSITLNNNIFDDPDRPEDFTDSNGYFFNRGTHTVLHECFHSFDANQGTLSEKPEWMGLSGWSKTPKPGLKRLVINEPGKSPVMGEMYFNPSAGFPRFYAKRNCWDDFADSMTFYILNFKNNLPENKIQYFNKLLKKYYG